VPLVYLLATAAAFDVWERRHDCATMGEGKATDEMDWQCTVQWPCMPIKTGPWQHGMKLISDVADPCQLLDN